MDIILKFSFICLCFIITLFSYRYSFSKKDWIFHTIGMTFTLISDFFLVIQQNQHIGFIMFCFVHIFYILRASQNYRNSMMHIIGTFICFIPAFIFLDSLIATMLIYACLFIQDIIANVKNYKSSSSDIPKINRTIILIGIILFALCDINVLLYELHKYITIPEWIPNIAHLLIWIFYTPAQFMLAISGIKFKRKNI